MTRLDTVQAASRLRPEQLPTSLPLVWLLGWSERAGTFAPQIETYGYRIERLDGIEDVRRSVGAMPLAMIIEGTPASDLMALVRAGAAVPGRPGLIVVDRGLEPIDRILALESGADDCVAWPCGARELVARIRAVTRRRQDVIGPADAESIDAGDDVVAFAGWTIDRPQRRLMRDGRSSETLPLAEFAVLDQLLRHPRRIVGRQALLDATASPDEQETRSLRAIDIQISRLRKRLELDGEEIIRTVRGRGYMLLPPVAPV